MLKAFKQGEPILAAIDAPADQADACQYISLQGMTARVPTALLRLAVEKHIPVTVYTTGLALDTGKRVLQITPVGVATDLQDLVTEVFAHLDTVIASQPAGWHFWSESPRIFTNKSI